MGSPLPTPADIERALELATPAQLARALAIKANARAGGRKAVLRPCPKCGNPFGARELREHIPRCEPK